MGLLVTSDGKDDFEAIGRVAGTVANVWNEYGGKSDFGFSVEFGTEQIEECSKKASTIFKEFFPNPPGPFKRVAALLVFGRLYPFFGFKPARASEIENEEWLSRIVVMMLPVALRLLRADISTHPKAQSWKSINAWKGFPSVHYKIEFLAFMQWLDNFQWLPDSLEGLPPAVIEEVKRRLKLEKMTSNRLARMILATSLIIEACYYASEGLLAQANQEHLRGKCVGCIDPGATLIASSYDSRLWENFRKANPPAAIQPPAS